MPDTGTFTDAVLDTVGAIVVVLDSGGRIVRLNRAGCVLTGYSEDEVIGKHVWDLLLVPEEIEKVRGVYSELRSGKFPNSYENYWISRDGHRRLIAWSNTALLGSEGAVEYVIGTGIDVSARKCTEQALEIDRDQLASIFDGMDESVYVSDPANYELLFMNNTAKKTFGDHIGEKCYQGLQKRDSPCSFCTNKHIFGDNLGKSYIWEFQNLVNQRWYRCIDKAIQWPDSRMVRLEVAIDINERKLAEQALIKEKNLIRTLLDNLPAFIYIKDPQSRYITTNRGHLKALGLEKAEDIVGKTEFDFLPRETAEEIYVAEQAIIKSGQPMINQEEMGQFPNGGNFWVLSTKVPVFDQTGNVTALVGITMDITARKAVEQELRKAKKEADAASIAKSDFLATMSHEIRTPLNAIIGMSGFLLDTDLTAEQKDLAEAVRHASDSLLSLINDILDVSKIEAGKLELEMVDFDLRETIEGAGDIVALKASQKNLRFTCLILEEVPRLLRGDPSKLHQVLTNLLGNAVKFTEQGEVSIRVSLERELDTSATIHFEIKDTGIGIPDSRKDRLFQWFSQVDSSITRKYGGTGLGLAISKRLVEAMGGILRVKSEVGKGSTFWFSVEFDKMKHAAQTPSEEIYSSNQATDVSLPDGKSTSKIQVLVVEDNVINQKVAIKVLERLGYNADTVPNGMEALKMLELAPYDIILMDVQMPEMDGFEATKMIRDPQSAVRDHNIPIIALTARAMKGDRERCLKAGMNDYVSKPLQTQRLAEAIERQLSIFSKPH